MLKFSCLALFLAFSVAAQANTQECAWNSDTTCLGTQYKQPLVFDNDHNISEITDHDICFLLPKDIYLYQGNDLFQASICGTPVRVYGGRGDDTIFGGLNNDELWGDLGNDSIFGGLGNDVIVDSGGQNALYGGLGDDIIRLEGSDGPSILSGGKGYDFLDAGQFGIANFVFKKGEDSNGYDKGITRGDSIAGNKFSNLSMQGFSIQEGEFARDGDDLVMRWWLDEAKTRIEFINFEDFFKGRELKSIDFDDGSISGESLLQKCKVLGRPNMNLRADQGECIG